MIDKQEKKTGNKKAIEKTGFHPFDPKSLYHVHV